MIKNINYPICLKCIWFRYGNKDMNPSGLCTRFGNKNLINGKITYSSALKIRSKKCGVLGKYYTEHNFDKDLAN